MTLAIVANVPDAEAQYQAHEFMDATTQPKSIWISPNEVYLTHALLSQHIDSLVCVLCITFVIYADGFSRRPSGMTLFV